MAEISKFKKPSAPKKTQPKLIKLNVNVLGVVSLQEAERVEVPHVGQLHLQLDQILGNLLNTVLLLDEHLGSGELRFGHVSAQSLLVLLQSMQLNQIIGNLLQCRMLALLRDAQVVQAVALEIARRLELGCVDSLEHRILVFLKIQLLIIIQEQNFIFLKFVSI